MAEETQTLEQTLEKTDFGHFVNQNKKNILIGLVVILVGIGAFSFFQHNSKVQANKALAEIYSYQDSKITPLLKKAPKDITAEDKESLLVALEKAPMEFFSEANFLASALNISSLLNDKEYAARLTPIFERFLKHTKASDTKMFFIVNKLAVNYENSAQNEKAIETLEKLVAMEMPVLKAKIYLDLGRLYKKTGNLDKARANFNYVVEKHEDSEYAKMAKLYLSQLK